MNRAIQQALYFLNPGRMYATHNTTNVKHTLFLVLQTACIFMLHVHKRGCLGGSYMYMEFHFFTYFTLIEPTKLCDHPDKLVTCIL